MFAAMGNEKSDEQIRKAGAQRLGHEVPALRWSSRRLRQFIRTAKTLRPSSLIEDLPRGASLHGGGSRARSGGDGGRRRARSASFWADSGMAVQSSWTHRAGKKQSGGTRSHPLRLPLEDGALPFAETHLRSGRRAPPGPRETAGWTSQLTSSRRSLKTTGSLTLGLEMTQAIGPAVLLMAFADALLSHPAAVEARRSASSSRSRSAPPGHRPPKDSNPHGGGRGSCARSV